MIFNRPDENVFASTAKSGEVVDFPDILRGWGITFDETGGIPPMEWFNSLGLRTDQAIQYFLQNGIAEWADKTDYPIGAYVRYNNKVWRAKKRNSGNEPSPQNDNWEQAALTLEEVKALIPQLMPRAEAEAGTSVIPRTLNAVILKQIKDSAVTKFASDEEIKGGIVKDKAIDPAGLASVSATTDRKGLIQIATNDEVNNGMNTTKAVTPASLLDTFTNHALSGNGYQILPGGLIIQWGNLYCNADEAKTFIFPIAFPKQCFHISGCGDTNYISGSAGRQTGFSFTNLSSSGAIACNDTLAQSCRWLALGI